MDDVEVLSIEDAYQELKKAVERAGGVSKFCRKHNINIGSKTNLGKALKGIIKPMPVFLRPLGIHKVYVRRKS